MDFIFISQCVLLALLLIEFVIRAIAPLVMRVGVGTDFRSVAINTPFLIRFFLLSFFIIKLPNIYEWLGTVLPPEKATEISTQQPIWLFPILLYSIYGVWQYVEQKEREV